MDKILLLSRIRREEREKKNERERERERVGRNWLSRNRGFGN